MPPPRTSGVDACPGALRLHAAADGPLARVRLPGGMLTGAQLAALDTLARECGDGFLELTSRANVQLRALRDTDPAELAGRLSAAGLFPSATHETVRNIAAPALAAPPLRDLVRELDAALCAEEALAALPGRFLFAIGAVPLDADVAAVPVLNSPPTGRPAQFALILGGVDLGIRVGGGDVVAGLLAAARAFLRVRDGGERPAWRLREVPDGAARVAAELGLPAAGDAMPPETASGAFVGVAPQGDGLRAVGAVVPVGRLTGVHNEVLKRADRLVVTSWRGVVVPDLSAVAAEMWMRDLAEAGLAVEAESRWTGVTACAGRPGCAKALADVRADADVTSRFAEGLPVHWIGCARGCGSPSGPHVRVEATPDGYRVSREPAGKTREPGGKAGGDVGSGRDLGALGDVVVEARRG